MKATLFKRQTILLLIFAFWLGFARRPHADPIRFNVKTLAEINYLTNGAAARISVDNNFLKSGLGDRMKLILEVGTTNLSINNISNIVSQVITNNLTNSVTNSVTNAVTIVAADTLALLVVDMHGQNEQPVFEFNQGTALDTTHGQRFLAFGQGCALLGVDCPTNALIGNVMLSNAVLFGTIKLQTSGVPGSVDAVIQALGDSDQGLILFRGTIKSAGVFIPAP